MSADTVTDADTGTVTGVIETAERRSLRAVLRGYPVIQLAAFIAVFVVGAITLEGFASPRGLTNLLVTASFLGIAAAGQTLVVLVGGIDLSIAAVISAAALLTSYLYGVVQLPIATVFLVVLLTAVLVGAINGYLSHRFQASPLIITLGMGFIVIGGVQAFTGGTNEGMRTPEWLGFLSRPVATTFGIPVPPVVAIWLVLAVLLVMLTTRTPFGRRLYLTGANPNAAQLALVRTRPIWMIVFAISALSAGAAGILLAGFAGSGSTALGDPYLFLGLAAVIVGGTTMNGRGGYLQTCIAALLLTALQTVLIGLGLTAADRQIIFGVLILVAVAGYVRAPRLRNQL